MARIEKRILSDHVYEKIKLMLENGDLQPGQQINKKELENTLGVSQTPINDALNRLLGEQYLEYETRTGYFIKVFTCKELEDLFATRAGIEGIAVFLCATEAGQSDLTSLGRYFESFSLPMSPEETTRYTHVDVQFHTRLVELSGNSMLVDLYERFGYMIKSNMPGLMRSPDETLEEHNQIVDALTKRNGKRAQALMTDHIMKSRVAVRGRCKDDR